MLNVTPVRAFSDNYIWLIHAPRAAHRVIAVDPGHAPAVAAVLAHRELELAGILLTHHHQDHVGGVRELLSYRDVPVYGPAGERLPVEPQRLNDGEQVRMDDLGLCFDVLHVPGHTAGHIAYVGHGALFCGDTLFSGGCGRLFEGTPEQMSASLARLAALDAPTQVYCAHEYTLSNLAFALAVEPDNAATARHLAHCRTLREQDLATVPSSLDRERQINPFLRCHQPGVRRAAEARAGRRLDNDTEVFAVIRRWKDDFH